MSYSYIATLVPLGLTNVYTNIISKPDNTADIELTIYVTEYKLNYNSRNKIEDHT